MKRRKLSQPDTPWTLPPLRPEVQRLVRSVHTTEDVVIVCYYTRQRQPDTVAADGGPHRSATATGQCASDLTSYETVGNAQEELRLSAKLTARRLSVP